MTFQTVAPFYSAKLGRVGAAQLGEVVSRPLGEPTRFSGPPPGLQAFSGIGQLREGAAAPQGSADALGPGGWTVATVIGAGMGGGIVGLVAGKGDRDAVFRGGFFSAALAGLGASLGHLRQDESKLFGASLLLGSLWTMAWALRPMWQQPARGFFHNR